MMPNLRAVVAQVYRSIGSRNISSSAARRKSNGRSSNGSVMGAGAGRKIVMTGQSHKSLETTTTKPSLPASLAFWSVVGYGCYALSDTFRLIIPTRQRREEKKLLAQRTEQVVAKWNKLSKQDVQG